MTFTHTAPALYGGTRPMACFTRMRAGVPREMQFTPAECTGVAAIVGIVPGMTLESTSPDIEAVIASCRAADPTFEARARLVPGSLFVAATQEVPEACRAGRGTDLAAYEKVLGKEPIYYRKKASSDTIRSRTPASVGDLGPGEDGWPPVNEYIHTAKAVPAAQVLALAIMDILGRAE